MSTKKISSLFTKVALLLVFQFFCFAGFSQITLRGKVLNQDGNPLPGAAVVIKGSMHGVSANANGEYKIENLKPGFYEIVASFLAFKPQTQEVDLKSDLRLDFVLQYSAILADEVLVSATRADSKTPVVVTNVSHEDLSKRNLGQDIPMLLSITPSFVTTTDAGAGVGYTGFRIRGSDANRINVTVDGIPLNDSESHGVFWVNMPDFTSSLDDIQIQRGVGTSTSGAGAFGASINMQTQNVNALPYAEISSSAGSFNTFKNTVKLGTGLKKGFAFDARLSKITSDGFIDRASSDLQSAYVSAGYYGERTSVKANVIVGKEKTYQAWNGVPKVRLENDAEGMQRYADHWLVSQEVVDHMLASDSRTYNQYTYDNETDNYWQKHYRLFLTHLFADNTKFNMAFHYTQGEGYYEQFKKNDKLEKYALAPVVIGGETIEKTDIIRRKWLDNDFYGAVFSFSKKMESLDLVAGGGWNKYDGDHFGEIRWMKNAGDSFLGDHYYDNNGTKEEYNAYVKANVAVDNSLSLYADMQLRGIDYKIKGIDSDLRDITQNHDFLFFNPKVGLNYEFNENHRLFASLSVANREPNRSNYTDAKPGSVPTSERLFDYELTYKLSKANFLFEANVFYMDYKDQLVLTGEINDVGSAVMVNVDKSYRTGVELSAATNITKSLSWKGNLSLSENKIKDFVEHVDNWDNWETGEQAVSDLGTTDLAFSPNVTANSVFSYTQSGFGMQLISQYVGKQYIDNSSNDDRSLDAYTVSNVNFSYEFKPKFAESLKFNLLVNNVFDAEYESNAWVYSYIYGGERYAMDGYFPQAGINFMAGLSLTF
ncbi:TonB-dependent receptor [Ancylomarina salipaludis]|uniref:TonB-dependent receptor n=1 Tax=Ancylomarina salipaludis TaxID=2501299 RepID=A0A4Q1JQ99_9BACT|nr:TonB-dependent receptor [Ancylomarina salipaludis]RXQ97614.1 TonB-dependent receptor [Ancylomarina salipaludis]